MFRSIFQLFKIARKLASSGAVETVNEIYNIPFAIKFFFDLISIGSSKRITNKSKKPGELILVYFNDERRAYYLSPPMTKKIIWGLFFFTLPLIWFSRGFSIPIVNSIMKIFNKGWKKL